MTNRNSQETARKGLTRDQLRVVRETNLARREWVDVPEWGGGVFVRLMTGTDRDAFEAEVTGSRGGKNTRLNLLNIRARFVARCLIGDDGSPLFDWRNPADVDELGAMDSAGLDRVFKACQRINGLTDEDVNDLAGNSQAETNGVSGSL